MEQVLFGPITLKPDIHILVILLQSTNTIMCLLKLSISKTVKLLTKLEVLPSTFTSNILVQTFFVQQNKK